MQMRQIYSLLCACAVMLAGSMAHAVDEGKIAVAGSVSTFTPDELELLANGLPVLRVTSDEQGEAAARIFGSIEIDAPASEIWEIMLDCTRAPEFVPGLKSCRIIETGPEGSWDIREHKINAGFIFTDVVNVFRSEYIPNRQITFRLVGGDLKMQEGTWQLEQLGGDQPRTRVIYHARLAIGRPVPRFMVRRSVRADMPGVFLALKNVAEMARESTDDAGPQ